MVEATDITRRLCDAVVETGLVTPGRLAEAQVAASSSGRHLGAVLAEGGLLTAEQAAMLLERDLGIPRVDLTSYAPEPAALSLVSVEYATANGILPLFEIEGVLTVAVGDPFDVFALASLAAEVGTDLEPVLAARGDIVAAIAQYYGDPGSQPSTNPVASEVPQPAPALELPPTPDAPVFDVSLPIDLDVLAVADASRAHDLAISILEHAVAAGASAVHLVPYKEDFFLAYRVGGTLERIASAPVALEEPLLEAFRSVARLSTAPASQPALGRARLRVAEREIVLRTSVVPTVGGQRMVLSLGSDDREVPTFGGLGMSIAEVRALEALLERGQGLLALIAPAGHGITETYYAALAHAAGAGRTALSVERSIRHEIPAVAQVVTDPTSPTGAAAMLAAALEQDTDILALDGLTMPEELRLVVDAALAGRLVIVTLEASDVARGIRHLFELGAEPHGLASALTLAMAQRRLRANCRACAVETPVADLSQAAWLPDDVTSMTGTGCPDCASTGFTGSAVLFETLPFTRALRAQVAVRPSAAVLAAAAAAAGMRSLMDAGIEAVRSGAVSADELARAMHLTTVSDRS